MDFDYNNIFKFVKSFERRYNEMLKILLNTDEENLSIQQRWSYFLELTGIESNGWSAYWNILRKDCEALGIQFPKVILVEVQSINYETLTANVVILSTEDGDEECAALPRILENAPLKDLYIIKTQENHDIDSYCIAENLDHLRIFYHHLWWPWDDCSDEIKPADWISYYLETRLQLYYDKLEGKVHYVTGKTIKHLLEKNQENFQTLENIHSSNVHKNINQRNFRTVDDLPILCDLYDKADVHQVELRQWLDPEIRKIFDDKIRTDNESPGTLLVLGNIVAEKAAVYVKSVQKLSHVHRKIKFISPDFQECLRNYSEGDVVVLTPGEYTVNDREYFDFPVTINGIDGYEETFVSDQRSFWFTFHSLAPSVVIEKITFQLKACRSMFIVKKGELNLNSVKFENFVFEDASAIYIAKNATLRARQCRFSDFDTAIVCMEGSVLDCEDCIFDMNKSCIQFSVGAKITMKKCDLSTSKDVPFKCDMNLDGTSFLRDQVESLACLKTLSSIEFKEMKILNEMKAVQFI